LPKFNETINIGIFWPTHRVGQTFGKNAIIITQTREEGNTGRI